MGKPVFLHVNNKGKVRRMDYAFVFHSLEAKTAELAIFESSNILGVQIF